LLLYRFRFLMINLLSHIWLFYLKFKNSWTFLNRRE
jgi:hypothetical protein